MGPGKEDLDLASEMDFINTLGYTSAFQQLRTQEQLGYIVYTQLERGPPGKVTPFDGEGGGEGIHPGGPLAWSVVVQSPDKNPEELEERVEAWIAGFRDELANISDEVFEATVASMVRVRVRFFLGGGSVIMVALRLGGGSGSACEIDSIAVGWVFRKCFELSCVALRQPLVVLFCFFYIGGGEGEGEGGETTRTSGVSVFESAHGCSSGRSPPSIFVFVLFFWHGILYQMETMHKRRVTPPASLTRLFRLFELFR